MAFSDKLKDKSFLSNEMDKSLGGLSPILYAAKEGLTEYIQSNLLRLKKDEISKVLNFSTKQGLTALHFACRYGRVDTVNCLLQAGASPLGRSSLGYLPIHMIFSDKNDKNTITKLFDLFIDIKGMYLKTNDNENIVHFAASKGIVSILDYVYLHQPEVLNVYNNQSMTPLLLAVLNNQEEAVKFLLLHSDYNLTNSRGQNALHIAAQSSLASILSILIPYFDIHSLDNEKHEALYFAELSGDRDKISTLLQPLSESENRLK